MDYEFRFSNFAHGELIALGAYSALFFTSPPLSLPLIWATPPAVDCTVCVVLFQDRLVGPNGSGKSTLFHIITGFHRADNGCILFRHKPIQDLPPAAINNPLSTVEGSRRKLTF